MTPSGIEPATFRFVAQHLNHCATAVPTNENKKTKYASAINLFYDRTSQQFTYNFGVFAVPTNYGTFSRGI